MIILSEHELTQVLSLFLNKHIVKAEVGVITNKFLFSSGIIEIISLSVLNIT